MQKSNTLTDMQIVLKLEHEKPRETWGKSECA